MLYSPIQILFILSFLGMAAYTIMTGLREWRGEAQRESSELVPWYQSKGLAQGFVLLFIGIIILIDPIARNGGSSLPFGWLVAEVLIGLVALFFLAQIFGYRRKH